MAIRLNDGSSSDYVSLLNSATAISDSTNKPFGFCGWFRRRTDSGTSDHPAGVYVDFSGSSSGWGFKVVNGSPDNFAQWKYSGSEYTLAAATLNSWIFLAYSAANEFSGTAYHGTSTTLTSVSANTGNGSVTVDSVMLGRYPSGSNPFAGDVAHWRIWNNYAPSQSDFEAEMVSAAAVRTSNLYLAWELVSNANDSSGNGRNGTVSGTTYSYVAGPISSASAVNPALLTTRQHIAFAQTF